MRLVPLAISETVLTCTPFARAISSCVFPVNPLVVAAILILVRSSEESHGLQFPGRLISTCLISFLENVPLSSDSLLPLICLTSVDSDCSPFRFLIPPFSFGGEDFDNLLLKIEAFNGSFAEKFRAKLRGEFWRSAS